MEARGESLARLARRLDLPGGLQILPYEDLVRELSSLAVSKPRLVRLNADGRSREGRCVLALRVGSAERVIAVTAGAHSDEPTGAATVLALVRNLLANPEYEALLDRFSFLFFPTLDPDGAVLNAPWACKPYDYGEFLLHNYRNGDPDQDCEHSIPVRPEQKARPEIEFFRTAVAETAGHVERYVTLHTTHRLGGSLFLLSEHAATPQRMETLTAVCDAFGVPVVDLDLHGEHGLRRLAPGFLSAPSMEELAGPYKDQPELLARVRMPTFEYMERRCGANCSFISELPWVFDEVLRDHTPSKTTVADLKRREAEEIRAVLPRWEEAAREVRSMGADGQNAWLRRLEFSLKLAPAALQALEGEAARYEGVSAYAHELAEAGEASRLRELGIDKLYVKCLEGVAGREETVAEHRRRFIAGYERLRAGMKPRIVPLETQVRIQTAMILEGVIS